MAEIERVARRGGQDVRISLFTIFGYCQASDEQYVAREFMSRLRRLGFYCKCEHDLFRSIWISWAKPYQLLANTVYIPNCEWSEIVEKALQQNTLTKEVQCQRYNNLQDIAAIVGNSMDLR